MAQQDEEIKKQAEDYESKRRQTEAVRPAQEIPTTVKILFVGLVAYGLLFTNFVPWSPLIKYLILMGAIVLIFTYTSSSFSKGEIPEKQLCAISYQTLLYYQKHKFGATTRIPQGRIVMNPVGVPEYFSRDSPNIRFWKFSFKVISMDGSDVFNGVHRLDITTGFDRGIVEVKGNFTGTENAEIIYVGTEALSKRKWVSDKFKEFPSDEE